MTSDDEAEALDKRLLGMVIAGPRRTLILAISTGLALGLALRTQRDVLDTLSVNHTLCEMVCDTVLQFWVKCDRAGGITERDFERLVREVIRIARSS